MAMIHELRKRARLILPPVLGACLAGYFVYHAVQGDRGLMAWLLLNQQIREATTTHDAVAAERAAWERRVALLRPGSLDPDMLEERARVVLNLGHPDELVILPDTRKSGSAP
jgi:cell division protein FtsB